MTDVNRLITERLDIWTSAIEKKSNAGRGNSGAVSLYGIRKLRALVLELAIRGKLVPQDANDGEANSYLADVVRVRSELVQHGKAKKLKKLPAITDSEIPFETPNGWVWTRLQDISGYIQRGKSPKYADDGRVQVVSQKCVQWGKFDLEKARCINDESIDGYGPERFLRSGDILWNSTGTGTVGRVLTVEIGEDQTLVADSHVTVVRPLSGCPKFLEVYLSSAGIQDRIEPTHERSLVSGSTKQVELNTSTVIALPIPLPPLAEQHRIVAKVDELMALCDALESQTEDSLRAHQTLVETCLATLINSQSPEDLAQNWARIENHFDTLFATEESVLAARETIRQLGVRGLLTPQDDANEPADGLVARLTKGRSSKKKRGRGAVGESKMIDPPFQLPKGWVWHRFGDLVEFQSELVKPKGFEGAFQIAPDIIEKGTGQLTDQRTVLEAGVRGPNNRFYEGQILYSKIRPSLSKAVIAPYDGLCSADMYPLKSLINPDYLLLAILSEDFLVQVRQLENRIKMPKLNIGSLSSIHIAVPPLAEQPRIVEQVRSLQTLCDDLTKRMDKSSSLSAKLADSLITQIH